MIVLFVMVVVDYYVIMDLFDEVSWYVILVLNW